MSYGDVENASAVFKLLGHPLRLRLVELLELYEEATVNRLAELTSRPQSTVSLYLNRLKGSGLLKVRRAGNERHYSLACNSIPQMLECVRTCESD